MAHKHSPPAVRARKSHKHLFASGVCRKHLDPISEKSLAARVCKNDPGLEYNSQAAMFADLTRYMDSTISKGVLLLVLCLFTWLNSVIGDASGALKMISAVCRFFFDLCHMYTHKTST